MKIIATNNKIISLENVCSVDKSLNEKDYIRKGVKCIDYITGFCFTYMGGQTAFACIEEGDRNTPKANYFWEEILRRLAAD